MPPNEAGKTPEAAPAESVHSLSPAQGGALSSASNNWFATAGICVVCHQNNVDEAGNDVSNGEYWRSTMMANSAKDPYYLAGVSIEVARYPEFGAVIEAKCNTCHMPMAHFSDTAQGQQGLIFGEEGQRAVFGPFLPSRPGIMMMSRTTGFVPEQGAHLLQSELCASCHNLYTNYITEEGELSEGYFPEQTPYSEWLNSDYAQRSTCQNCHMPPAEGAVVLANQGPPILRSPYAKHSFVGGNVYILQVLKSFGGELGVQAGPELFDATIARTLTQLQTQTAALAVLNPVLTGATLDFDVLVDVLTGHKFPTSYPSRRAWLHVTVKDTNGQIVFESGGVGQALR
jgi:cytochrome c551/c552